MMRFFIPVLKRSSRRGRRSLGPITENSAKAFALPGRYDSNSINWLMNFNPSQRWAMSNQQAEIITRAINDLRKLKMSDVEIAIDLLGGAIPVMIEATGTTSTCNYLHSLADMVHTSNIDNINWNYDFICYNQSYQYWSDSFIGDYLPKPLRRSELVQKTFYSVVISHFLKLNRVYLRSVSIRSK